MKPQAAKHEALWPAVGCGVGLRTEHYDTVIRDLPDMDWFEAVTENFMDSGGRPVHVLETVRKHYPVALHGVSLSIGSADAFNPVYLSRLRSLVERVDPFIVSDHLCWTGVGGEQLHDLLPLPFTEEALKFLTARVSHVQDFLKRSILLENISTYVTYKHSTIPEWEFLAELAKRSGCGILLDLNNIYVNSRNHGFDSKKYIEHIPSEKVGQFHLAGHKDMGDFLFDTHGGEIIDPVWELYRFALERYGQVSTLIEWDENIPSFERLAEEADRARKEYVRASPEHEKSAERISKESSCCEKDSESLRMTQESFKEMMRAHDDVDGGALLNSTTPEGDERRFSVYRSGYYVRLTEALREIYEAVSHVTGEDAFSALAAAYADRFPSREYNLNHAGRYFSAFLETSPVTEKLPFLPDLAGLEWLIAEAFHAFDLDSLTPETASVIPAEAWETKSILFQPSVGLSASEWPIFDIWKSRNVPVKEMKIQVVDRPQNVLVFRNALQVQCKPLSEEQFSFFRLLFQGASLGEACGKIAERDSVEPSDLTGWFSEWMGAGLITGLQDQQRQ